MLAVSIPKEYCALVHDVKRISTLNFNVFTLRTCLTEIGKLKQDGRVRQWPCGNLALLQYLYWEKVQPTTGPKNDPLSLQVPLMKNWSESKAEKRDKYDLENGRGHGLIDDCITKEYRMKKLADEQAESSKNVAILRLLEKMNKTGVRYKPGTMAEEEENLFGQNSESRYENKYPKKEFQYDDIHTPNGRNGSGHYDLDSEGGDSFKFSTGHLSSYKELFNETTPQFDHSVDDMVRATVQYVKAYEHSPKHKNHEIFNNGKDEGLSAARVIDAYATYISDSSIVKDRKKELDSLRGGENISEATRKFVENFREQLAGDIQDANDSAIMSFPDVSAWPIVPYNMPQQEDGNSCGLFVLRCFQYWDGEKFITAISQESIDSSRERMIAGIILSPENELTKVKNKIM
ncbi:uncharacterized protein [Aegilops tauschii subsp. strangulata]|uniref:uncharacterized protein n=1 Tax=Aegilops tauschii subsp. strangulata TaxID=200361 RepID=UPI003CC8CB0C